MNDSAIFGMLGLLIGGAGVWAVMRARVAIARMNENYHRLDASSLRSLLYDQSRLIVAREATISRLSDTVGQLQDKRDRALECVTDRSAHVGKKMAAILTGERL